MKIKAQQGNKKPAYPAVVKTAAVVATAAAALAVASCQTQQQQKQEQEGVTTGGVVILK